MQWSSCVPGTDERGQVEGEGVEHTWKQGFSICGFLEQFYFETYKQITFKKTKFQFEKIYEVKKEG